MYYLYNIYVCVYIFQQRLSTPKLSGRTNKQLQHESGWVRALICSSYFFYSPILFLSASWILLPGWKMKYSAVYTNLILESSLSFVGGKRVWLAELEIGFPWLPGYLDLSLVCSHWLLDFYTLVCFTFQEHPLSFTLRLLLWDPVPACLSSGLSCLLVKFSLLSKSW